MRRAVSPHMCMGLRSPSSAAHRRPAAAGSCMEAKSCMGPAPAAPRLVAAPVVVVVVGLLVVVVVVAGVLVVVVVVVMVVSGEVEVEVAVRLPVEVRAWGVAEPEGVSWCRFLLGLSTTSVRTAHHTRSPVMCNPKGLLQLCCASAEDHF